MSRFFSKRSRSSRMRPRSCCILPGESSRTPRRLPATSFTSPPCFSSNCPPPWSTPSLTAAAAPSQISFEPETPPSSTRAAGRGCSCSCSFCKCCSCTRSCSLLLLRLWETTAPPLPPPCLIRLACCCSNAAFSTCATLASSLAPASAASLFTSHTSCLARAASALLWYRFLSSSRTLDASQDPVPSSAVAVSDTTRATFSRCACWAAATAAATALASLPNEASAASRQCARCALSRSANALACPAAACLSAWSCRYTVSCKCRSRSEVEEEEEEEEDGPSEESLLSKPSPPPSSLPGSPPFVAFSGPSSLKRSWRASRMVFRFFSAPLAPSKANSRALFSASTFDTCWHTSRHSPSSSLRSRTPFAFELSASTRHRLNSASNPATSAAAPAKPASAAPARCSASTRPWSSFVSAAAARKASRANAATPLSFAFASLAAPLSLSSATRFWNSLVAAAASVACFKDKPAAASAAFAAHAARAFSDSPFATANCAAASAASSLYSNDSALSCTTLARSAPTSALSTAKWADAFDRAPVRAAAVADAAEASSLLRSCTSSNSSSKRAHWAWMDSAVCWAVANSVLKAATSSFKTEIWASLAFTRLRSLSAKSSRAAACATLLSLASFPNRTARSSASALPTPRTFTCAASASHASRTRTSSASTFNCSSVTESSASFATSKSPTHCSSSSPSACWESACLSAASRASSLCAVSRAANE
mmetsp:Transcript_44759/g.90421  ORF Transcript_44759/g.90421 Transcript_44759/m.90421 type:complete len:715 (+) Transcript_44759:205-2349(+)